jgi:hypothetical protein
MRVECVPLACLLSVCIALLAYYVWRLESSGGSLTDHYLVNYGDLAEGFYHGHLTTNTVPDAVMRSLPNPYDPTQNAGHEVWDYSYYRGNYYLYYGAPPVLFLFLPYRILTGEPMSQGLVLLILCAANLAIFVLGLRALARLEFPRFPVALQAALLLLYGMGNGMPYLMCTPDMYQIAVMSASSCLLLAMVALLLAVRAPGRGIFFWLAVAGGACAMAAACRAIYLFPGLVVPFVALYWWRPRWKQAGPHRILLELGAFAVPAIAILACLGWYNWARFGSPLEFGQRYLVAGVDYFSIPCFSLSYFPDRFWEFFLMPYYLVDRFPFIDPSVRPQNLFYGDRIATEHVTGIIPSYPFLVIGLCWLFNVRRLPDPAQRVRLMAYGTWISIAFVGVTVPILIFDAMTFRYITEITTPLFLLSALSLMARHARGLLRAWEWSVVALLFCLTLYSGFAYSIIGDNVWIWHYDTDVRHLTLHQI